MIEAQMSKQQYKPEPDFHGGAVIDERGREVPITESMVRQACQALEKHWQYPVNKRRAG